MNKTNKDIVKLNKLSRQIYNQLKSEISSVLDCEPPTKKYASLTLADIRDLLDFYSDCRFSNDINWSQLYDKMESLDTDIREDYIPNSIYNLLEKNGY